MFDFDEIMRRAQNGEAADNLASSFNLSQKQMKTALDMLLPVIAEGFRRNAQNMNTMAGFFDSMSGGRHASYFTNPAEAFSASARGDGNELLGMLFGSNDMMRMIAEQTAKAAGTNAEIIRNMMPHLASILAGGMEQQARDRNPFEAMMKQMCGVNPFTMMMENFFKVPAAPAQSGEGTKAAGGDEIAGLWQDMFQAGRKVQDAQAQALERIFEEFKKTEQKSGK
ncbi:MAG: DUF937 domain-containing protein [Flavobacteriaceae bacterium]